MEYKEVIALKKALTKDEIRTKDGILMRIMVTPDKSVDLLQYLYYYRNHKVTDEMAKLYSSNNKYKLTGIWTDGVSIVHKKINLKNTMNLNGTWINKEQGTQINLMYQKSDDYLMKYNFDGNDYNNEEIVPINRSTNKILHIMKSTMFGNCSVSILDEQNIIIGNTHFQKIIL